MESIPVNQTHHATETHDWQAIIAAKEPFEDEEFPPALTSIYDKNDHSENANIELYESLEWKKPAEIYPDGFGVFPDELKQSDKLKRKGTDQAQSVWEGHSY